MGDQVPVWGGWRGAARPSTGLDLADHLRMRIISGELPEGSRLPPQEEFAAQLGVARSVLREALGHLEQAGYLCIRRGRTGGSFVQSSPPPAEAWRDLEARLEEVAHAYEYRVAVEGHAARLAAERRDDGDLAAMRAATDVVPGPGVPTHEFRLADGRFHGGVADAARSPFLADAVRRARTQVFMLTDRALFDVDLMEMQREHRMILEAIADRDAAAAGEHMTRHLRDSLDAWRSLTGRNR